MHGIIVNTTTSVSKSSGTVTMTTSAKRLGDVHSVGMSIYTGTVNANSVQEGDAVVMANKHADVTINVNKRGEVILVGKDADKYYVNQQGELCRKI